MVKIVVRQSNEWANYHKTIDAEPQELSWIQEEPEDPDEAIQYFGHSQQILQQYLATLSQTKNQLGAVGGGWSFNELLGSDKKMLELKGLSSCFPMNRSFIRSDSDISPENLVLVAGGTPIKKLNDWLEEEMTLSLKTSGAHNGQTIGGAIATGTHGSVIGFGGIQNHVRGIQIIGGPQTSYWVGQRRQSIVTDAFVEKMGSEAIWDDELFDASLIHLGGLGLVNAYLLEVADLYKLELIQKQTVVDETHLELLVNGDWSMIAANLCYDRIPYYYELIIDPFAPFENPAIHRAYLPHPLDVESNAAQQRAQFGDDDPTNLLGQAIAESLQSDERDIPASVRCHSPDIPGQDRKKFTDTWGGLNAEHVPRAPLYNAAFAIDKRSLLPAIKVMCEAVHNMHKHFVFTMRLVKNAAGAMAFTRFDETVVINLDGLGESRSSVCPEAAEAAGKALKSAGIDYSLHWGKLGGHNASDIEDIYAPPNQPDSPLSRWRAAREKLVHPDMRPVLTNDAIQNWNLV